MRPPLSGPYPPPRRPTSPPVPGRGTRSASFCHVLLLFGSSLPLSLPISFRSCRREVAASISAQARGTSFVCLARRSSFLVGLARGRSSKGTLGGSALGAAL